MVQGQPSPVHRRQLPRLLAPAPRLFMWPPPFPVHPPHTTQGTPAGETPIPESAGLAPACVFLACIAVFQLLHFYDVSSLLAFIGRGLRGPLTVQVRACPPTPPQRRGEGGSNDAWCPPPLPPRGQHGSSRAFLLVHANAGP